MGRCSLNSWCKRMIDFCFSSGAVLRHLQPGPQRPRPSHHQRHRRDGAMVAEPAAVPQHRVQRGERHTGPRTGRPALCVGCSSSSSVVVNVPRALSRAATFQFVSGILSSVRIVRLSQTWFLKVCLSLLDRCRDEIFDLYSFSISIV